ncbi:MAG: glycosyltransferase [Phycisphaerae bacterium]|nr:glycosyltransferase [Phycisphaerae bacterium]
MASTSRKKVAFISSFLPRKCGIATFTSDLITNVAAAARGHFTPLVAAMHNNTDAKYTDPVKFEIRQNVKSDYISAADYLNFSNIDLVSVQHEFGLFGGDAGSYLGLLLNKLNAPVVTTLHTVLDEPNPDYYKSMVEVCDASYKVITMNRRGVGMLQDIYGIDEKKIRLIPHGIPDLPFVDNNYYKFKFGMEGRRTILTFGLLSKNKGIEIMLRAMPEIIKVEPSALYVVLGMTHPEVLKYDGESYRFGLQRMVAELGLQNHVIFHNRFVKDEELHNFLCAADVYVTPYLNREQLTSGTLSFAVGTGKAVVSTPYWAAEELLDQGQGVLVPFNDSAKMAQAVSEIFKNNSLFYSLRKKAYEYGRSRTWPRIGKEYWQLFCEKQMPICVTIPGPLSAVKAISAVELPELKFDHLKKLTDDTGLYQHAKFTVPDRSFGYCTDDNARALIVTSKYYSQYADQQALDMFDIYLSFLLYAQNEDGSVRNFMNFDRTWMKKEPDTDALGRFLWALGHIISEPPSPYYLSIIKDRFDRSAALVEKTEHPHNMAYAILGMASYLEQFPGASDIKRLLTIAADNLAKWYKNYAADDWQWFYKKLTYDNAVLPNAMYTAAAALNDDKYLGIAEKTAVFLLSETFNGSHFSFIGCNGWYEKGKKKTKFDQQPIEAAGTILMLKSAYNASKNKEYIRIQRKAFDWFLGGNDIHMPLYDFKTKGCCDAIMQGGININQGAESTVSFLLGLLAITEGYTIEKSLSPLTAVDKNLKAGPVADIVKTYAKSNSVKEFA